MHNLALVELISSHHSNISVEDASGDEYRLFFIIFFLMQVEDLLDTEGSHVLGNMVLLACGL